MKKSILLVCAAALVMFAACQKEESLKKSMELSASVEQQADPSAAKSTLDGTTVKWVKDDAIEVFDNAGKGAKLEAQSSGTSSSFKEPTSPVRDPGFSEDNLTCAIYPYSAAINCSGTTISFNLPATQTYAENSFGQDANVAVGTVNAGNIDFKNVCGALKLQLKGSMKVKKIILAATENVCGTFSVNASTAGSTGAAYVSDGGTSLTLDCSHFGESSSGAADGGVQLDSETTTNFYFVVPVGALAGAFSATIYDVVGDSYKTALNATANSSNTIARKTITVMPSIAVSLLPEGYTELKYLESTGTQYCNTGVKVNSQNSFYTIAQFTNSGLFVSGGFEPNELSVHIRNDYAGVLGNFFFGMGQNSVYTPNILADTNKHIFYSNVATGKWQIDDKKGSTTPETEAFEATRTDIFIFARSSNNNASLKCEMKLFHLNIWTNNVLVKYFIPAKKSDGTLGVYDLVDGVFCTNLGSGSFVSGGVL